VLLEDVVDRLPSRAIDEAAVHENNRFGVRHDYLLRVRKHGSICDLRHDSGISGRLRKTANSLVRKSAFRVGCYSAIRRIENLAQPLDLSSAKEAGIDGPGTGSNHG